MPSPDLIAPERLDKLLAGALPDTDREARVQGLALELRSSVSPAPERLRERIRALPSAPPRRRVVRPRRLLGVLVPTCLVATVAAALVFGNGSGGEDESGQAENESGAPYAVEESSGPEEPTPVGSGGAAPFQPMIDAPGGRARDIDMWIELRVRNGDQLAEAAEEAARITRELGGFVAASTVRTSGTEGRGELILRVPTANVDDAAFRLSGLGTVANQRVATEDLQTELDGLTRRIETIDRAIRIAKLRLESGTLDADERLRVEIRLERLFARRGQLDRSHGRIAAEAATAELTLLLHTREAAAGAADESGIGGAAKDALDFLARAGSIAVFLVIVLSPVLFIATLVWLALRTRARRSEAQLLERARPMMPSPQPRE